MIKPRVDKLLDHADSHYAAVVVAAKRARRSTATSTTSARAASASTRRRWWRPASETNYLSMALEELAEGKLKYEYRA